MNKKDRDTLLIVGGLTLLAWLCGPNGPGQVAELTEEQKARIKAARRSM